MEDNNQQPINIELTEDVADGIYSNLAIIAHSNSEFIIDFVRMMPNVPKAKVKSRIILTPQHAKRLLMALGDNLAKFEREFGTVDVNDLPGLPMTFGGPAGMA
jgi:hypothetical protein